MPRLLSLVCLITALLAPGSLAAAPLDLAAKIDPLAKPLIDEKLVVGCVIGIIKDGQSQVLAYGETEKGSSRAPAADTVYEIGSVTKVFTAVLLADMVRRGEVKLDDNIQSLLPADRVTIPTRSGKRITLEQIATHHSGLPRMPGNFKPADPRNPYADYSVAQMYTFLSGHQLARDPGQSYEYSNLATGLLGHALALKAKTDYETIITSRICKPLSMSDTTITLSASQRKRLAPPYNAALRPEHNWDLPTLAGAGAIRSTATDMLKFLAANLADDDADLTKSLRAAHERRRDVPGGLGIALGWHIARDNTTLLHNGQTAGYHAFAAFNRKARVAAVVLSNTATGEIDQLGELCVQVAAGQEVTPPPRRKAIAVDEATLKSYVGQYALAPTFILTVTLEDGRLMVQATGQEKIPVFAESKTRFFYKAVDAQITFTVDEKGAVTQLILHQNGRDMPAARGK